jgi:hypothetical protein
MSPRASHSWLTYCRVCSSLWRCQSVERSTCASAEVELGWVHGVRLSWFTLVCELPKPLAGVHERLRVHVLGFASVQQQRSKSLGLTFFFCLVFQFRWRLASLVTPRGGSKSGGSGPGPGCPPPERGCPGADPYLQAPRPMFARGAKRDWDLCMQRAAAGGVHVRGDRGRVERRGAALCCSTYRR